MKKKILQKYMFSMVLKRNLHVAWNSLWNMFIMKIMFYKRVMKDKEYEIMVKILNINSQNWMQKP